MLDGCASVSLRRRSVTLSLVLGMISHISCAQAIHRPASAHYVSRSLCSVLSSAPSPDEELVVRGTYRYGYEWQDLYCVACLDKGRVWVDVGVPFPTTTALPKRGGTVNITVKGRLRSGGKYGHLNGYDYELKVTEILEAVVVSKSDSVFEYLPADAQRKVCQQ